MTETLTAVIVAVFASTGFWGLITAVWQAHNARKERESGDLAVIKAALLSVLYDKLYERSMRALRVGEITAEDRENIRQMLTPYENLGGDGLIHDLCERVEELPLYIDQE